jgi:hypothetical protein
MIWRLCHWRCRLRRRFCHWRCRSCIKEAVSLRRRFCRLRRRFCHWRCRTSRFLFELQTSQSVDDGRNSGRRKFLFFSFFPSQIYIVGLE